ncbi:hypothetical protein OROMI_029684 [Orobanche minor]
MAKATNTTTIPYLLITTAILTFAASLSFTTAQLPTANTLQLATMVPIKVSSSPGPDCFTDVADLADCLSYVEGGSNMTKPDPSCCPEMSNLLSTHPTCLCELIANSTKFGLLDIDADRAIGLPSFCNLIKGSPVDLCEEMNGMANTMYLDGMTITMDEGMVIPKGMVIPMKKSYQAMEWTWP